MNLENLAGDLRTAYRLAQPGSIQHVDQLMKERQTNEELRNLGFYTADGELYFLQGKKRVPTLAMTRGHANPLLQDSTIDNYCNQLLDQQKQNYHPTEEEFQRALKAKDTELFDLTKLGLQQYDNEFSFLPVSTTEYSKLNPEQRRLAERVFGKKGNFAASMKLLHDVGVRTTRVYVLASDYVSQKATGGLLGRASWLGNFYDGSNFNANDRNVNYHSRVRGVRRGASEASHMVKAPAGRASKIEQVPSAPSVPVAVSEIRPPLEQVLACLGDDVASSVRPKVEERIRKLYKR